MNTYFNKAHTILKNLKSNTFNNQFGFGVFNYCDVIKKYEKFKSKWEKANKPQIYFVTMDVEKCYDNVSMQQLVKFIKESSLLDKEIVVNRLQVLKRKNNLISIKNQQPIDKYFKPKFENVCLNSNNHCSVSLYDIL